MMLSNDLLSYSIMQNGEKTRGHFLPHYASLSETKLSKVTLPPIISYVSLTENNLNSLNTYLLKQSSKDSAPPSLTSSSSVSESPLGSPRLANSSFSHSNSPLQADNISAAKVQHSCVEASNTTEKKRRQRLGPSCDNCRARKVKCNADVVMINRYFTEEGIYNLQNQNEDIEEFNSLSPLQKQCLFAGECVSIESNYVLVLHNHKLIKYRPCMSCASKSFTCCFSKGFTKEDIVQSKRHVDIENSVASKSDKRPSNPFKIHKKQLPESISSPSVPGKLSTRKSSCVACRKRKVKCVVTSLGKCVGCTKKDIMCTF